MAPRSRFSWNRHGVTALRVLMVVALLVWPLIFANKYHMRIMTTAGLYALLTIGVVIVLGQAGQLSFGHSAFYGIGAYMAGILAIKTPIPTPVCLIIGALAAGLVALIVGRPVLKLRYFYLALATIGLGQIFLTLVNVTLRDVTGGSIGFAPVPKLDLLGLRFAGAIEKYYLVWVIVVIVLIFISRALKYRMGRAFRAIATSEIASSSLGMRTANWKLLGFVTSAVICGLAGGLFAFVAGAINPGDFTFELAIIPIVMMLIGGAGSVWGAVVGAVIMIYIKDWLPSKVPDIGQWSGVLYSGIMILLLMLPAFSRSRPSLAARTKSLFARVSALFHKKMRESAECLVGGCGGRSDGRHDWGSCPGRVDRPRYRQDRYRRGTAGGRVCLGALRWPEGGQRSLHEGDRGPDRGSHRSQRGRQDHVLQCHQPVAEVVRGQDPLRGQRRDQDVHRQHGSSGHGPHLPEPAHLPEHERARERPGGLPSARKDRPVGRRAGSSAPAARRAGVSSAGHAGLGCRGARRSGGPSCRQPSLRLAAPGGDRPSAGLRAAPAAAGRARRGYERL